MKLRVQYFFGGDELPVAPIGLDEEYPEQPIAAPSNLAASSRASTIAAAAFVIAIGGGEEVLPNAGGLRLFEEPPPVLPAPEVAPPFVQVFTGDDELPVAAVAFGLAEEGAPVFPAPGVAPPSSQIFAEDEELPNAGGLRLQEEDPPVLPAPHVDPPVVGVFAVEDDWVPPPVPINVDEPAGPTLPDPETTPLNFYSVTVTFWGDEGTIALAVVLAPPDVVDAPPRRWKVDAEVRRPAVDAPPRTLLTDDH